MLLFHRTFIKTALVFILLGVIAGAWMLLRRASFFRTAPISTRCTFTSSVWGFSL